MNLSVYFNWIIMCLGFEKRFRNQFTIIEFETTVNCKSQQQHSQSKQFVSIIRAHLRQWDMLEFQNIFIRLIERHVGILSISYAIRNKKYCLRWDNAIARFSRPYLTCRLSNVDIISLLCKNENIYKTSDCLHDCLSPMSQSGVVPFNVTIIPSIPFCPFVYVSLIFVASMASKNQRKTFSRTDYNRVSSMCAPNLKKKMSLIRVSVSMRRFFPFDKNTQLSNRFHFFLLSHIMLKGYFYWKFWRIPFQENSYIWSLNVYLFRM